MFRARFALGTRTATAASCDRCARGCPALLVACALFLAVPAPAAAPAPRNAISATALADCRLTVRARQALLQDRLLAPLNLGVSVRTNVATLWGRVPSRMVSERAAECLRRVSGVADVVNQLVVDVPGDALVQFLQTPPGLGVSRTASGQGSLWHPTSGRNSAKAAEPRPGTTTTVMPVIPLPTPEPTTAGGLAQAVERLRQGKARLRGVRAEINGGVVRLRGQVSAWPDLYDLAKAIARLAGVRQVVIDDVGLDPNPPPIR
jgi:osmotically-inducible protein OsmY